VIVAVDVIEHLAEPDHLLNYVKRHATEETLIIISTPDRDLVRGFDNFGPPWNVTHVREWNQKEFKQYFKSHNFAIHSQFLVEDRKRTLSGVFKALRSGNTIRPKKTCQVCLCTTSSS
jgi:2-polyprenyl-3-methyl-5-hydroxy-6-metoxy-1,4-benzoquinol methylase